MAAIPSSVNTPTLDSYLTADQAFLLMPDVRRELIQRYMKDSLTGFLELTSAKEACVQTTYTHVIEDSRHENFGIDSMTAVGGGPTPVGAGNAVVITLPAADHDSSGYSYPRVGFTVINPAGVLGKIIAKGTTPGANTVTILPYKSTEDFSATLVVGTTRIITLGSAYPEYTTQPEGLTPRAYEYENNTMIIKETFQYSGSAATDATWFDIPDGKGGTGRAWTRKAEFNAFFNFLDWCELQMLFSDKNDNLTDGTKTTEGLIPGIRAGGNVRPWTALGGFTLSDFDNMIATLDTNRAGSEFGMWMGLDLFREVNQGIMGLFQNGAISYGAFNGSKEIAVSMGFSSINYTGYTFHFSKWGALTHPRSLGTTGYNYRGMGVVVPMGAVKTATGTMAQHLRIRYKALDGYSREYETWYTGGANGTYTETLDGVSGHHRTERGLELMVPEHFVLIEKA